MRIFYWLFFLSSTLSWAWENHPEITRYSLLAQDEMAPAEFSNSEDFKRVLQINSFAEYFKINEDKINWNWKPQDFAEGEAKKYRAIDILAYSSLEPDFGIDQNLNLSADQKYLGGFEGLSSQGFRHLYFRGFDFSDPLTTLHYPAHEMGEALKRIDVFFNTAIIAKKSGHLFWAYRFLGFALHYLQDINQPYHTTQVASLKLLPLKTLLFDGWDAFVKETTRIVANYHLSFEQYIDVCSRENQEHELMVAFKVAKTDQAFKYRIENEVGLTLQAMKLETAKQSSRLSAELVNAQDDFWGQLLNDKNLDLRNDYDQKGIKKIHFDFSRFDQDKNLLKAKKRFYEVSYQALSNVAITTRWLVAHFNKLATN